MQRREERRYCRPVGGGVWIKVQFTSTQVRGICAANLTA